MADAEKILREQITVWIKGGHSKEEIKKRLEDSFTSERAFELGREWNKKKYVHLGLKLLEHEWEEFRKGEKEPGEERAKKWLAFGIVCLSIVIAIVLVYFLFVENSVYSNNWCNAKNVEIRISGGIEFRAKISNALDFLSQKDCGEFLLVTKNIKAIEFEQIGFGTVDEKSAVLKTGLITSSYWYDAFFSYGACTINQYNKGEDAGSEELQKECFDRAARITRIIGAPEDNYALWLENKEFQKNWREFWISKKE